jgi:hypothetical protein
VSNFIKDFYGLLGIKQNASTAYHPQTDGQTERVNQELEQYLRLFINHRQTDWADWLAPAQFSYNDKVHSATGYSPFYVNYGRHPWKGGDAKEAKNEDAEELIKQIQGIQKETEAALKLAAETMKRFYDRKARDRVEYDIGDKVWLEATNLRTDRPAKKLDHKRYGPFKITAKAGKSAYKLELPRQWHQLYPVFHESLLHPYNTPDPLQTTVKALPPVLIDGTPEYEVERILNSRRRRGRLQFLIKWKGYGHEENTWESKADVKNAPEEIKKYYRDHPNAPK